MDSLELKVPAEELEKHLSKLRVQSSSDRKAKGKKAPKEQQKITASKSELQERSRCPYKCQPGKARKLNYRCNIAVDVEPYLFTLSTYRWFASPVYTALSVGRPATLEFTISCNDNSVIASRHT